MANNYDRIFKENIDSLLLPLLKKLLGLNPPNLAPIDAKMQVTQEGEMDHIRRVVHDDPQQDYGLQIEFHVKDEDLRKRNLFHYALFHHITSLPLRQIVIYGGIGKPLHILKDRLQLSGLELQFEVIVLHQIPKEVFLESDIPEEVVLAILCHFGEDQPESVIRQILQHLKKILRRSDQIKKYQKQLLILSRLRKMELIVKTEVEAMTIDYDIETDGLYLQGKIEGKLEGVIEGKLKGILQGFEIKEHHLVLKLWSRQDFSIDTMATLVDITPDRTRQIILSALQAEGLSETEANQAIATLEEKFNPPMKE
jgi:hypothetical protein